MDPATATLVGTIGAGVISAGGNLAGAGMTNQTSARVAKENRDWQETMANTAYQRATADMRAAGLNPGLMYGTGGAADTPSGAVPMVSQLGSLGSDTVNSAASALSTAQQLAQLDATLAQSDANKTLALENAAKAHAETGNVATARALMSAQTRAADASAQATELDRQLKAAIKGLIEGMTGKTPMGAGRSVGGWLGNFGRSLSNDFKYILDDYNDPNKSPLFSK